MPKLQKTWTIYDDGYEEILSANVGAKGKGLELNSESGYYFIPESAYDHLILILKEVIKERDEA